MKRSIKILAIVGIVLIGWRCTEDPPNIPELELYQFPDILNFSAMPANSENPVTKVGVELGRKLFFDPILSLDSSISCGTCHQPERSFASNDKITPGVNGGLTQRNAMTLLNLAWYKAFNWDGKEVHVRDQNMHPVPNAFEMALPWVDAVKRLKNNSEYVLDFEEAFPDQEISMATVTKALEQFELTLISYNSPFDKYVREEAAVDPSVLRGFEIFSTEKGDCFHCHSASNSPELLVTTRLIFTNNGMDTIANPEDFEDIGLGAITGNLQDNGKFKIPTLRNLIFTAPYMHDGRFNTLDEVIEMYNLGPSSSPSVDPQIVADAEKRLQEQGHWGLALTEQNKADLKAFLLSLTDETFINNPAFQAP